MWGLANSISKYYLTKVFADYQKNHQEFDGKVSFSIERIGGVKLLRKVTDEEVKAIKENAIRYQENWKKYSKSIF